MLAYILRRLLYAIPILIGVNLITFALFFVIQTPRAMAIWGWAKLAGLPTRWAGR